MADAHHTASLKDAMLASGLCRSASNTAARRRTGPGPDTHVAGLEAEHAGLGETGDPQVLNADVPNRVRDVRVALSVESAGCAEPVDAPAIVAWVARARRRFDDRLVPTGAADRQRDRNAQAVVKVPLPSMIVSPDCALATVAEMVPVPGAPRSYGGMARPARV